MGRLEGKVAVVTGAASGIGRASAERFAQEGARVVVADVQVEAGRAVAASLPGGLFVKTDVSNPAEVEALVAAAMTRYGRLDIMFNNAGIAPPQFSLADIDLAEWRRLVSVNLDGVLHGIKYAVPALLNSGGGAILNTASITGLVGFAYNGIYSATKAGVIQLTKVAALEYARSGIRVNAIAPGATDTAMLKQSVDADPQALTLIQNMMATIPIPGLIPPEQIASAALYLVSDEAAFVTGVVLPVDGGYVAQ